MSQAVRVGAHEQIKFVGNAGMLYKVFLDRMLREAEDVFFEAAPYDIFSEKVVVTTFLRPPFFPIRNDNFSLFDGIL